jgi:hypothetical protein
VITGASKPQDHHCAREDSSVPRQSLLCASFGTTKTSATAVQKQLLSAAHPSHETADDLDGLDTVLTTHNWNRRTIAGSACNSQLPTYGPGGSDEYVIAAIRQPSALLSSCQVSLPRFSSVPLIRNTKLKYTEAIVPSL